MRSSIEQSLTEYLINLVRRLGTLSCFFILLIFAMTIETGLTIISAPEDAGTANIILEASSLIVLVSAMISAISSTRLPKQVCKICFSTRPTWNGNFDVEVHQRLTSLLSIGFRNWFFNLESDSDAKVGLSWRIFEGTVKCTVRALKDGSKTVSVASHLLESDRHTELLIARVRKTIREFDVSVTLNQVELSFAKRCILAIVLRRWPSSFPTSVTRLVFSAK